MNNGFTYNIAFDIANSPLNRLLDTLDRINRTMDSMGARIQDNTSAMTRFAQRGSSGLSSLNSGFGGLLGTIGATAIATKGMHDAMDRQSSVNAINFASGGVAQGAENINHIRDTIERLGLPLTQSMNGFKVLEIGRASCRERVLMPV